MFRNVDLMGKCGKVWESLFSYHFPTGSCVSDVCENDRKVSYHFRVSMFTGVNVHWGVAALRAAGRASRAIFSKNFLQDKGSISDKESISDKGSISDKESIYLT